MYFDVRRAASAVVEKPAIRRHPRALFSVPITLRYLMAGGIRTSRGISLDISEEGLGAIVQGDLCLGETVEIDLRMPENPLSTVAIVRHTSSVRSGFEFLGLTPEERRQIMESTKPLQSQSRTLGL